MSEGLPIPEASTQLDEDAADIAECLRSEADPGPRYTHEEVLAILAADDASGA